MNPQENALATKTVEASLLDRIAEETARIGQRYMPTLTVKQFTEREKLITELRGMLIEGTDYGVIPGTDKPTLLLPGAQKVCAYFGYVPHYIDDPGCIEDWNGSRMGEPLFYYRLTCVLAKDEKRVGEGVGSCNSWESKFRFRWVAEEVAKRREDFAGLLTRGGRISESVFAIDKAETGGKYGKPMEHWAAFRAAIKNGTAAKIKKAKRGGGEMDAWEIDSMLYRIPNDGFPDVINTILKMAKKRSYIDATLSATGLSQYFTQDLEDQDHGAEPTRERGRHEAAQETELEATDQTLPVELAKYIQDYRKGEKAAAETAAVWLQDQLVLILGKDGASVWRRFREAMPKRFKTPQELVNASVAMMLECYGHIQMLRKQQEERKAEEATIPVEEEPAA